MMYSPWDSTNVSLKYYFTNYFISLSWKIGISTIPLGYITESPLGCIMAITLMGGTIFVLTKNARAYWFIFYNDINKVCRSSIVYYMWSIYSSLSKSRTSKAYIKFNSTLFSASESQRVVLVDFSWCDDNLVSTMKALSLLYSRSSSSISKC